MNRRSFFKVLTGYVAGVFGVSAKAKSETKTLFCKGKDYPEDVPIPAEIPTEWAKQKYLTLDEICRRERKVSQDIYGEPDKLNPMTMGTSSNNVNVIYSIRLPYWDKDEPDIYTFNDGIKV